jgi:hypothetical protein
MTLVDGTSEPNSLRAMAVVTVEIVVLILSVIGLSSCVLPGIGVIVVTSSEVTTTDVVSLEIDSVTC